MLEINVTRRHFFWLRFKVRQGGVLRASKLALAWEFCAKEEDGKESCFNLGEASRAPELNDTL
jgi:hypothetical protein